MGKPALSCRAGREARQGVLAPHFFAEGLEAAAVHSSHGPAEEEPDREAKGESGEDRTQGSALVGMLYRKPAHAVKLTGANVLLYPHSRSESPVSEPNAPPGSSRLRWGLVALIILTGIGLALAFAPRSEPIVQVEGDTR